MISEKRLLANRENARKSTGPKTREGKTRSRRNALKHGLTGEGVVLSRPDEDRFQRHLKELSEHLQPIDVLEKILVSRVAMASSRLEKCAKKEHAQLAKCRRQAILRWEKKQILAADQAIDALEKQPAEAVAALMETTVGCEWLLDEWQALALLLDEQGFWIHTEASHALRLLGQDATATLTLPTAAALWEHAYMLGAGGGDREAALTILRAIIASERTRLETHRERVWNQREVPAREEIDDCAGIDTSEKGSKLLHHEKTIDLFLHRNLNRLIALRKIEPEHQSVERWHKTGKLKLRRWDGISYAPTNPYYFSSGPPSEDGSSAAGAGVGGSGMEDGRTPNVEEQSQTMADRPDPGSETQQMTAVAQATAAPAAPGEKEATESTASQVDACTSGAESGEHTPVLEAVRNAAWVGSLPLAMWPEELVEGPEDEEDDAIGMTEE
ncbi:MAG TPA: hypothetical protein VGZ22_07265 [Isosphaeraceae bacterium]|nr:hypothetical protein [Isosphaeraceae bacterium]